MLLILMLILLLTACESKSPDDEDEIEVGLLDRALLESVKFSQPDSFKLEGELGVLQEDGTISLMEIRTDYAKGYSTRQESVSEGETDISIYNADEGITYEYILGESTGRMYRDDEDDILDLEKKKAMEG